LQFEDKYGSTLFGKFVLKNNLDMIKLMAESENFKFSEQRIFNGKMSKNPINVIQYICKKMQESDYQCANDKTIKVLIEII